MCRKTVTIHKDDGTPISSTTSITSPSECGQTGGGGGETEATSTLHFDANGGTDAPKDISLPLGGTEKFTIPDQTPSRDGYDFLGWGTSKDDTTEDDLYWPGDQITANRQDITLFAIWDKTSFSLTYDPNGGVGTAQTTNHAAYDQITIDDGSLFQPPAGKTFNGWNTKPDGSGDSIAAGTTMQMGDKDRILYAQWADGNAGTTIACAPQTGDPSASLWQWSSLLGGVICVGLAFYLLALEHRSRRLVP